MIKKVHIPVLLQEVLTYLSVDPDGTYIDCTLGDGGYSVEILKRLNKGRLVSLDCDEMALDTVKRMYPEEVKDERWTIVHENFAHVASLTERFQLTNVNGIVFDLGLSTRQLESDTKGRGFSHSSSDHLDMRMDTRLGVTADDLIKASGEKELENIIRNYGEDRHAKRIAAALKDLVRENPTLTLTSDRIAARVRKVVPAGYREGPKHPARRVFQALRIAVNNELQNLQQGVASALTMVAKQGIVVVVSFHSLEDRIVKELFKESAGSGDFELLTTKPIIPTDEEIARNPRSASAKLRAIKKK